MRVDAIREDRHRGGRSSYEGARFQMPRGYSSFTIYILLCLLIGFVINESIFDLLFISGTGIKKKYIENIYGGVELTYAFQVPQEPVVPKLIQEIVRINEVIILENL